jgi:hypothetical protein
MKPTPGSPEVSTHRYKAAEGKDLDFYSRPRSPEDLAKFLGCTARFIRNEVLSGRLKACRLSSRLIRLLPGDIKEWLEKTSTI